jgi:hypothetical protein
MPSFAPSLTMTSLPGTVAVPRPLIASSNSDWQLSLHNILGIVNPLQHLPVVGTLYRAITGDKIGVPEKIAGDALYGGLWGAVSAVADTAFEAATGKDFGSTVMARVFGDHSSSNAVADNSAAPAGKDFGARFMAMLFGSDDSANSGPIAVAANDALTPNVSASTLDITTPTLTGAAPDRAAPAATPDVVAFTNALAQKGIDSDIAQRALMAYRRSQAPQSASSGVLLAVAQ